MAAKKFDMFDLELIHAAGKNPGHNIKVYEAAKAYVAAGFYVIPIVKNGKAIPPKKYNLTYGNAARNPKTIEKWFGDGGVFEGWNIGIATGKEDGVFVLDVDLHGDVDGFETLNHIIKEEGVTVPAGPVQKTPNGGAHYFMSWQNNATSSTNKIGPGIDTRGGTIDACKGHVVVWPSIVDDKSYEWETAGPIPVAPKWIMEKMGVAWNPRPREYARGNENVDDSDLEEQVPLAQIERALNAIDPNELSYDDWLKIGMAIKSQHPDDGLAVWDEWSRHGERYDPKECNIRWNGFNEMGAVRIATLFWHAKAHGHEPLPTDTKPNKFAMVTERLNLHHAIVVTGNKIRVLREIQGEREPMASAYNLLTPADFKTLMSNDTIPGEKKPLPVADIWMGDPQRRTFAKGIGLFPQGEPEGYYNTWRGFAVESVKGGCGLFKDHIKRVVCDNDNDIYEYVLDWCADLFQDPANPKGVAIVMRGDEGTGKGTFADTIGMMCAPHYTHLIDENHLTGQFNSHMSESIVVFADEITWGGNRKTAGKLKGMVTEKYMLLERKGIDAVSQRNMCHMIIASNSEWVIPAGMNSRRWLVLDVNADQRNDSFYFTSLNDELDDGGREAFMFEMMERKITSKLGVAPVTEALIDQRAVSVAQEDVSLRWWRHVLNKGSMGVEDLADENNVQWPGAVHKYELYEEYERWCMDRHVIPQIENVFYKKILTYGFVAVKKRIQRKQVRVYNVPEHGEAIKIINELTGLIVENIYDEES